jgi:hypothetical protein
LNPAEIVGALRKAGATFEGDDGEEEKRLPETTISSLTLYKYGMIGQPNSKELRASILHRLGLPGYVSTKALIEYLKIGNNHEAFFKLMADGGGVTQK